MAAKILLRLLLTLVTSTLIARGDQGYADPRLSNATSTRMLTPEVADFLKHADRIVAVVIDSSKKIGERGYETKPRELVPAERADLVAILAAPENYYQGLYTVVEPPPTAGFEFWKGQQELLLVTGGGLIDGRFGSRRLDGMISDMGNARFTKWWEKYNPFHQGG